MPSKYPTCTPEEVCRALKTAGFSLTKQKGSHAKFTNGTKIVIVPMHHKDLKVGTLKSILEQADISVELLIEYLK